MMYVRPAERHDYINDLVGVTRAVKVARVSTLDAVLHGEEGYYVMGLP